MIGFKEFLEIWNKYEMECERIFNTLKYLVPSVIDNPNYAIYNYIDLIDSDENKISLIYEADPYYDLDTTTHIDIPSDIVFNEKKLANYIQKLVKEEKEKKIQEELKKQEHIQKKEYDEYLRLKEKFEKSC